MNDAQREQMTNLYVSAKVFEGADLGSIADGVVDPVEQSTVVTAQARDVDGTGISGGGIVSAFVFVVVVLAFVFLICPVLVMVFL